VGGRDELCPLPSLEALMAQSPPSPGETQAAVQVIDGADHFFGGAEEILFRALRDFPW